jgi:hypothetical protein
MATVPNTPVSVSNTRLERNIRPRAPRNPIEAVYTNYDVNPNISHNRRRGYKFQHPDRWINEMSNNKMIGIRRLQMIPSSHIFELGLLIYMDPNRIVNIPFDDEWKQIQYGTSAIPMTFETNPMFVQESDFIDDNNTYRIEDDRGGQYSVVHVNAYMYKFYFRDNSTWYKRSLEKIVTTLIRINPIKISVLDENHTSEILEVIRNKLTISESENWLELLYDYNPTVGSLSFEVFNRLVREYHPFSFHIDFLSVTTFFEDLKPFNEMLRFFNQEINSNNYSNILKISYKKSFDYDVWDRKKCQFHSNISDTNFGYLGLNNDFYQNPSKLFSYTETSMDFYLSFTTNGREHWIPRHIDFIVELIYIFMLLTKYL